MSPPPKWGQNDATVRLSVCPSRRSMPVAKNGAFLEIRLLWNINRKPTSQRGLTATRNGQNVTEAKKFTSSIS